MTQRIEKSIIINRPIEEVFDVATCLESCVNWQTMMIGSEKVTPGAKGVGTQYKHTAKFMGIPVITQPVITVNEPPHRFAYHNQSGAFGYEVQFNFESVADGTRFDAVLTTDSASNLIAEIAIPLLVGAASRQYDNDLSLLKGMMETGLQVKKF
ncbi:MAG: SRPBCC family protein, partial [Chloroflexota bacterium]|nr:SRPBCC family protein [Chloroflexota bacterium]